MRYRESTGETSLLLRCWSAGWRLVLFVGLFLLLYMPFVLPFILYADTEYQTLTRPAAQTGVELLAMVCVLLAALGMTRYVDRRPLAHLGLHPKHLWPNLVRGIAAGALLVGLTLLALTLLGQAALGSSLAFDGSLLWVACSLFCNVIYQEVLVHGYLQQMIRSHFSAAAGVVGSAVVFVLLHWTLFNAHSLLALTNLFAAGVVFGLAFVLARNLWWPIGIHFGWNVVQGLILGLPVTGVRLRDGQLVQLQGPTLLTGGDVGIEGGVIASAVLVAAAVVMWVMWQRRTQLAPDLAHSLP